MLQISNLDDGKSEWNMNETHIITAVINGDVITTKGSNKGTSMISLNTLDDGDQTILKNGLEHNLVIGLDRNLFETHNNKADLLVIQNSDIKLLSCSTDLKTPNAYTLSYVDQDRNEVFWESPVLKDKTKSEWCSADKTIFEVKDVLNYDDSSKNWQDELEKSRVQINFDDVGNDLQSQVAEIDGEILIPVEAVIHENEKSRDNEDRDSSFNVNYYSAVQTCGTISLLPSSEVVAKPKDKIKKQKPTIIKNINLISNESFNLSKSNKLVNSENFKNTQETLIDVLPEQAREKYDESINQYKTELSNNFLEKSQVKSTKDYNTDKKKFINGVSSSLPEKSLPLKKKAKMKRTIITCNGENVRSLLKQDIPGINQQEDIKFANGKKSKLVSEDNLKKNLSNNSDSDEPLINKIKKKKKLIKCKNDNLIQLKQSKKLASTSLLNQLNQEKQHQKINNNLVDLVQSVDDKIYKQCLTTSNTIFDKNKCNNIYELVEELKKCRIINASISQILQLGLKEMDVDILKEMITKERKKAPCESYSPQLKAFALVLYFKQPAAFNHLSKMYKNGWPSLNVLKEWKRRVNSYQRPNFLVRQKEFETSKS